MTHYTNDEIIDGLDSINDNFTVIDDDRDGIDIIRAASQRIKQQMDTLNFLRRRLNQCEHLIGELYISQRELEEELYGC